MQTETGETLSLIPLREVRDELHSVPLGVEQLGVMDCHLYGLPRGLHHPVHVGLESGKVLAQHLQVKVVDNHEVPVHGGDYHLIAASGKSHPHQSVGVEHSLVLSLSLLVLVDVPGEDGAVKAAGDEEALPCVVLYVLHPVGVTPQGSDFVLQVPHVPQHHAGVVRAGGEGPAVQEPDAVDTI